MAPGASILRGNGMRDLAIEGGTPLRIDPWPRRLLITEREVEDISSVLHQVEHAYRR